MRHTDAEINKFASAKARELSDGCSKTYHEIKQSLTDQLNKANENADEDEDPPDMNKPGFRAADYEREMEGISMFLVYGFVICFILIFSFVMYATIVEVPQ